MKKWFEKGLRKQNYVMASSHSKAFLVVPLSSLILIIIKLSIIMNDFLEIWNN